MVSYWSLSDSKSHGVSRTLLSILVDLNNSVVWMVSTCPSTSNTSSPLSKPLWSVPRAPITIGIIITLTFPSFLSSPARSEYFSLFSLSFIFTLWSAGTSKLHYTASSLFSSFFFLLNITRFGLLAGIRWSVWISKSQRILCASFKDRFWFVHIIFGKCSNFSFLHNS